MKRENNIRFISIIALICIASLILAFTGIYNISTAMKSSYEEVFSADDYKWSDSIVREGGYRISETNTFLLCLTHQRIVVGGVLAFIGGLGVILCIHWFLVWLKLLLKEK